MPAADPPSPLPRRLPLLLALACGVAVANVYFPQALTPLIAEGLGVGTDTAAGVATLTQLGYAAGIFALVPLGDRLPRRSLTVALLTLTALALVTAGLAPTPGVLLATGIAIGTVTVVPQLLIPMAAALAGADRRGQVIGTLQGGLIGGILLARTFGAAVGSALGWRAPYLLAALVTGLLAVGLARALPPMPAVTDRRYRHLLADTARLLAEERDLRRSVAYQAGVFAGFSAAWTALALLVTGPAYRMGTGAVGVLALIGAVSMLTTPAAGRVIDRRGPDVVNGACVAGVVGAAGVLALGATGGLWGLAGLVAGLVGLDVAVQGNQVANQARILTLRPEARSRLNTAYMTCSFLAGSAGSALGVRVFAHGGWTGVCVLIAAAAALPPAGHLLGLLCLRRPGTAAAEDANR